MKIEPYGKNILVVPVKKERILVSESDQLNAYGEVTGIGEDVKSIKVGDIIAFTKWGIREVEVDGEKHFFVPEDTDFLLGKICTE